MPPWIQEPSMLGGRRLVMDPLRFALILHIIVDRRGLTWSAAAKLCGLSCDRLEKIARGQNVPLAPDVLRIMKGLGITFKAEDFEIRGLSL